MKHKNASHQAAQQKFAQRQSTRTFPLAAILAKYAIYMLVSILAILAFTYTILLNGIFIYPANWGERHINSSVSRYSTMTNDQLAQQDIPSAFHYAIVSDKKIIASDMDHDDARAIVSQACISDGAKTAVSISSNIDRYARCFTNADNSQVVLTYSTIARFTSRTLRDTLPSAELTLVVFNIAAIAAVILVISIRQAHIIQKELATLTNIALRIKERNLEPISTTSSLTEFTQAFASFEMMRASLKESLDEQFNAQEKQRKNIQALTHDMKTPLTIMRGNAELLETTSLDEEQKDYVHAILSSTNTMDAYVSELSGQQFHMQPISLEEFIHTTEKIMHDLCEATHIKLEILPYEAETLGYIEYYSSSAWQRILSNLVNNCKAHSGRTNDTHIILAMKRAYPGTISITIADNGIGFSADDLAYGTQWSYTSSKDSTHQGVGLAASSQLVGLMNGKMSLRNAPEGGAALDIDLPLARGNDENTTNGNDEGNENNKNDENAVQQLSKS